MKRIITIHVLLLFSIIVFAQKMSVEKASQRAYSFLESKKQSVGKRNSKGNHYNHTEITLVEDITDDVFIWNIGHDNGFIILGNDERINDVIGYSDEGHFDINNIPDGMKEWLDGWSEYIEDIQGEKIDDEIDVIDNNSTILNRYSKEYNSPLKESSTIFQPISPLLSCKFSQNSPYNLQCPIYSETNYSAAGCVAIAMAQILYYYKPGSCNEISGYTSDKNGIQIKLDDLPATTFNWDNVHDFYYSTTNYPTEEIAKIVRYCGQSCMSNYGSTTSANISNACEAFINIFNFSKSTKVINRTDYTSDNWNTILYKELSEGRPIMFSGRNNNSGHSFICDGYDSNGLYHINWGWGGISNGYFMIDYLSPSIQSTGGSSSGYSMKNSAIVGIKINNSHCAADDIYSDSHGSTVNYKILDIEPYKGKEKIMYNVTYRATVTNNGATLTTPLYVYLDNSSDPITGVGVNIDKSSTGYVYFNVYYNTTGNHTITLKNTNNKVLFTKNINIQDASEYNLSRKYTNVTKINNGILNEDSYTVQYSITNNSKETYNDYIMFNLYRVVSFTTDENGNKTPKTALKINTKSCEVNIAPGTTNYCVGTFDDFDEGETYYVYMQYLTKVNGTAKWTGGRTGIFTYKKTVDKITELPLSYPTQGNYSIDGKTITLPHGIYISNGRKYIRK